MVKKFHIPDKCEECEDYLEKYFGYCRKCNLYFCHDCSTKHYTHEMLACKKLGNNEGTVMELGNNGGYGPKIEEWVLFELDNFYTNTFFTKCEHATAYLENKEHIFLCHDCREYICLDCLEKHENHPIMLKVVVNDDMLRELDPNLYEPNIKLEIDFNLKKYKQDIIFSAELKNDNKCVIYNIETGLIYLDNYQKELKTKMIDELKSDDSFLFKSIIPNEILDKEAVCFEVRYSDVHAGIHYDLIKLKNHIKNII